MIPIISTIMYSFILQFKLFKRTLLLLNYLRLLVYEKPQHVLFDVCLLFDVHMLYGSYQES